MDGLPNYPPSGRGAVEPDKLPHHHRANGVTEPRVAPANFGKPPQSSTEPPRSLLIQIIEGEIIPRLFLAHCDRTSAPDLSKKNDGHCAGDEFLAELFVNGSNAEIVQRLESLMHDGVRREIVYLELLASVPRALVVYWEKGQCTFESMSEGLHRLDHVMREMHEHERERDVTECETNRVQLHN